MKYVLLPVLFALVTAATLQAQDATTDSNRLLEMEWTPVSYLVQEGEAIRGAAFGFGLKRSERLTWVLDFGFHKLDGEAAVLQNGSGVGTGPLSIATYRFGPRFYGRTRGRFTPFAEVLGGGGYVGAKVELVTTTTGTSTTVTQRVLDTSHNGYSFAAGGGLDMQLKPWLYWRVVHANYSFLRAGGNTMNGVRFHTGGLFRF